MKAALRVFAVLVALAALAAAGAAAMFFWNMRSYERLTYERPVADITFEARGPQRYVAVLTHFPTGEVQTFDLAGDEWQVDARVLKWTGIANVLGLNARYRLERISGRYTDVEQEKTAPRSVYSLNEKPWLDLWALASAHPGWFPFMDGLYGSATYLPMSGGGQYEVTLTQSGVIARPINEAASAATRSWR